MPLACFLRPRALPQVGARGPQRKAQLQPAEMALPAPPVLAVAVPVLLAVPGPVVLAVLAPGTGTVTEGVGGLDSHQP